MVCRAVNPYPAPTLDMACVATQGTLPRPSVVQPPYQLPTQVTPGGVVAPHLPPTVPSPLPHRLGRGEDGRHFYSLAQTGGADRAGTEHCKDNVWL